MKIRKVMTYNIHIGFGMDKKLDMERIAGVIDRTGADLTGINEIDQACERSGRLDQPGILRDMLRQHVIFAQARPIGIINGYTEQGPVHGGYGVAAVSRTPLLVMEQFALRLPEKVEPRTVLIVKTLEKNPVYFAVTHLPWEQKPEFEAMRVEAIELITRKVKENRYFPCILTGDLNAANDSDTLKKLRQNWTVANDVNPKPTFPANSPRRQLDYVAFYPQDAFTVLSCEVIEEKSASDHRPVVAVLKEKTIN